MTYSIDANGNDNQPEWGYCTTEGCREDAFPIWQSGGEPDDPDHLLCPKHIGELIGKLETQRRAWTAIGAKAETDAGVLRTCLLAIRAEAAEYGPEPHGITKGYVWAGALLRQIDAVLTRTTGGSEVLRDLEAAYHALMSYACGNSAPLLAEEMAAQLGRWIGKAGKG